MRFVILLAAGLGLARANCISVPSPNIVAGDLAGAVPQLGQLDAATFVGFAPFPGTQRVLSSHEMFLFAQRHGLAFTPGAPAPSVCVQRIVRPLSADEVRPALLSALGIPDVQMEIVEVSAQPVPAGRLEFAPEGLNRPRNSDPSAPVLWRGRLVYDGQHILGVWARVRLAVPGEVVVAAEEIPAGSVIHSQQLRTVTIPRFPAFGGQRTALTAEQFSGKVARRKIAAGDSVTAPLVQDDRDVTRGDTVRVLVVDGAATITLEGVAESSGNKGQAIVVHNPSTGKNFRAVIESQKRVIVRPPAGASL